MAYFELVTRYLIRLAGRVTRMGERRGVYRVLIWKPEGDPGVDGMIILRLIFRK